MDGSEMKEAWIKYFVARNRLRTNGGSITSTCRAFIGEELIAPVQILRA